MSNPIFFSKIVNLENLGAKLVNLEKPLVFTNGVFDILHTGHVSYLAKARELGENLIVAINSDASVKKLDKGADRPINKLVDRLTMLAALESVSLVTWFEQCTPLEIIRQIQPNILVKGGDYDMEMLPESTLMHTWGGHSLTIPLVAGYSTTSFLKRIKTQKS